MTWYDKDVQFSRYSSAGQDFSFEVDAKPLDEIWEKVFEYYENYDCSYEAYLWLDNDGHGKNGAPYEMIDVYNDMKECEEKLWGLSQALKEV